MRYFLDACYPSAFVAGYDGYLAYCDGKCAGQSSSTPQAQYIISSLATNCGTIGDVEPGNPWWDRWVPWVQGRRAAGVDPTLYCCADGFGDDATWKGWRHQDGVAAFAAAGVPEPHWWVFWPGRSDIPDYAVALQTGYNGGYDISLVRDIWPGVDPTFTPPVIVHDEETEMYLVKVVDNGRIYMVDGRAWQGGDGNLKILRHIELPEYQLHLAAKAAGAKIVELEVSGSQDFMQALGAAADESA